MASSISKLCVQSVHHVCVGLDGLPTTNQPSIDNLDGRETSELYHKCLFCLHPIPGKEGVKRQWWAHSKSFSDEKINVAISAVTWCLKPDCSKLILLLICRWLILGSFGSFHERNKQIGFLCGFGFKENINLLFGFDKGNLTNGRAIVSFVYFQPLFVSWLEICWWRWKIIFIIMMMMRMMMMMMMMLDIKMLFPLSDICLCWSVVWTFGTSGDFEVTLKCNPHDEEEENCFIIRGDFFHWYPLKKLKYGKPRVGKSTLA